jgi:histidyl-tRNA synthetase
MQPAWRDGPIRAGRYREFWQCDVDVVGVRSVIADAEILAIVEDIFGQFKLDIIIKVNDRELLYGLVEQAGILGEEKQIQAIMSIDKLGKLGKDGVKEELLGKGFAEKEIETLLKLVSVKGKTNAETISKLEKIVKSNQAKDGLAELKELLGYIKNFGLKSVELEPSLARGLAIYTGPIYEVFTKKSMVTSSIAGGGRYDKIIGKWMGSAEDMPATGISFGLSTIVDVLEEKKKLEKRKTAVKVFVIPIGVIKEAVKLAQELRRNGINADLDLSGRGISKNLDYANRMQIPFVIFLGEKELKAKKVKLRDMKSGKEKLLTTKDLIRELTL